MSPEEQKPMAEDKPGPGVEHGSSPASRGAAGAYIEGELGALYLLALLTGNRAPGMPDARVVGVRFQGTEQGFKLDDLIVRGAGTAGDAILEIQSKRDITFSPRDTVYKDVAFQIAGTVVGPVPEDRHLLAIATERTSRKISGAYQDVLKWARAADSAAAFFDRLGAKGVASKDMRDFVETTRTHLTAGGVADEDDAIWRLLRRMLILEFDFEATTPVTRSYGQALARVALADEDVGRAKALWSRLIDLSIKTGTTGGEVDRVALLANLAEGGFRLAGAREYGPARARLAELARNTLAHIGTSVAGVTLPRLEAVAAVDDAAEMHRFIEIRGMGGVGKSWVLRHHAERVGRQAPIIVLDRNATTPGGWLPFSNALGIPGSASDFLTDLAASGGSMLFIDGIDMFDDGGSQRTIAELLRAAAEVPGFKVVATTRTADDVEPWLDDQIVAALGGAYTVEVGPLSEDEVSILVGQAPELRSLLDPKHPAAGLARNLYRLSRLLKVRSATGIRTEAAMAGLWWRSADSASPADVRAAQRLMAALADSALKGGAGLKLAEDSSARSHLIDASTLRELHRDQLDFHHDVLRDWAIGNYIAEDPRRLAALDLSRPVSSRVARGIEFAARLLLETGADDTGWVRLLEQLSVPDAHGSWRRQAILALPRSEAGYELLEKCTAGLLADGAALLVELCTTIGAVETKATADLMTMPDGAKVDLPRSYRIDVSGSALVLLRWVLAHAAEISMPAIGPVVELVAIQLHLLQYSQSLARQTAVMLLGWLRQLDVRDAEVTIPSHGRQGRAASEARSSTIEQLRLNAMLLCDRAPEELKAYLREIATERNSYKVDEIRLFSRVIAPVAPAELADLVLASLLQNHERPRHRGRALERAFTFADSNYLPASPAQPPFLDLLDAAPAEGLRLIRTLVAEAIAFDAEEHASEDDGFTLDLGEGDRLFPHAYSYLWSRDQCGEYSAASGLKALEAWSQGRLDEGVPVNDVLADILGPEGSCAAYLLVAVDVLLSHFHVARDALAPFLADPELLATDRMRRDYDLLGSGTERLFVGREPNGKVRLADLRNRPSRHVCLFDVVRFYVDDDPVADRLREQLGAAVEKLEPIQSYSNWVDARLIGRVADNLLQRSNWIDGEDGNLTYRAPLDEAAHFEAMEKRRVEVSRRTELEAQISLAIDGGGEHATAATARDAVAYAAGGVPDDSDTDTLKSRSTRLVTTALLAARDGDDALLAAEETWIRRVIAIALEEQSDRGRGSKDTLQFNRPAIAILALIHLWVRKRNEADRNELIRLATRSDRSAALPFSIACAQILENEPMLLKAAMRAAFANMARQWRSYDDDEAEHTRFEAERAGVVESAVAAEIGWMDGGAQPAWPTWPDARPHLRLGSRIPDSALISPEELEDDEASETDRPSSIIHVDSAAAARWLCIVRAAPRGSIGWSDEVVEAYLDWTNRMNGLGLPADVEIGRELHKWDLHFYALFTERLLDAADASFETDVGLVTNLPDEPFCEVARTVLHTADALYFNDPQRPARRPVELRARVAERVTTLRRWRDAGDPASSRIDMESGGIIAKTLLNTYNPFNGTDSYLPELLVDRVDPLLRTMRPLLPGGPTAFVAVCTMNLLLIAPRARHLDFLLDATDAWYNRTQAPGLWTDRGIGRKVVRWFEAAIVQEPGLLGPAHPLRAGIDRALGRLVSVGIAEAHELELQVEAARAMLDLRGSAVRGG